LGGRDGHLDPIRGETDPWVCTVFGRVVAEHEDLSVIGTAVDPVDPIPSLDREVVPAPARQDCADPAYGLIGQRDMV
jgi:hypothetical protein